MRDTIKQGSQGATVRELQTMLNTVGADLLVDGDFGETTDNTVRDFQEWKQLTSDGVVGPKTWASLEDAIRIHQHMQAKRHEDKLTIAGENAIARAVEQYALDIHDPNRSDLSADARRCKEVVDRYIQGGLGWTWEPPYKGDGYFEWCGAFAAYCWSGIKPGLRKDYFASTYRLDRYGRYEPAFGEVNTGKGRLILDLDETTKSLEFIEKWKVAKGDILLIGPGGYGQHICLVESFDESNGIFNTLEGNGNGIGPTGARQQGVVRGKRTLGARGVSKWCARRIIRPSVEDLV